MTPNTKHPAVRYALALLAIAAVVAVVWFLVGRIFPSNPPGPTKSERTADSLRATKPADNALIDSSNARIRARGVVSGRADAAARLAQDRANRARRIADSLAIAREWEGAYISRTEERDSLVSVVASDALVIFNLKADTTELRGQLGIVNKRLKTTEDVNSGLQDDLERIRRCKILGFINCPSRIQTAALTALTVVVVDRYRRR